MSGSKQNFSDPRCFGAELSDDPIVVLFFVGAQLFMPIAIMLDSCSESLSRFAQQGRRSLRDGPAIGRQTGGSAPIRQGDRPSNRFLIRPRRAKVERHAAGGGADEVADPADLICRHPVRRS